LRHNGARVPLGYAVEDVEKRGHWTKERLAICLHGRLVHAIPDGTENPIRLSCFCY
jgi:hypothetical protein